MNPHELIVFVHNDLDALGCMLNIEYRMPNIAKKYFFTNYANIDQRVQEIEAHIQENGNTHILIADVSFSDNKESLRKLYSLGKCTHIDHHLYPDGFWDEFPNMKVHYDKKKCATLLCNEYFGNTGKHERLDKLTRIIDVYDLWQVGEPEFKVSQDLNEYFWTYDIELLCKKIVENDYRLPDDFKSVVQARKAQCEMEVQEFEERKLIQRNPGMTVAFVKEWFNHIMLKEMEAGQNIVVGICPYGIVKVRVNKDAPFTPEQLNKVRKELTGTENIGHMLAFTYRYEAEKCFENTIKEVQKIVQAFANA
ncbi:phosphoesterase [Vibrio phage Va1]|nr:phosphoesterase [Vibrio phage Va1]